MSESLPSVAHKISAQLCALTAKNVVLLWRRKVTTTLRLLLPAATVLLAFVLKDVLYDVVKDWDTTKDDYDGADVVLELHKCQVFDFQRDDATRRRSGAKCITLAFSPNNAEYAPAMRWLAARHGLEYGVDVVGMPSAELISAHIFNHPGEIDMAVVFDNGAVPVSSNPDPALEYQLWYNATYGVTTDYKYAYGEHKLDPLYQQMGLNGRLPAMQKAINDALTAVAAGRGVEDASSANSARVGVVVGTYPELGSVALAPPPAPPPPADAPPSENESDLEDRDPPPVIPLFGALIVMAGVTSAALLTLYAIMDEKRVRILGYLRGMGCNELVYWISWLLPLLPVGLLNAVVVALVGNLTGLWVFTKCDFGVHVVALMLYDWALTSMVMLIAACCKRAAWVNSLAFLVFCATFVSHIMFNSMSVFTEPNLPASMWDAMHSSDTRPVGTMFCVLMPWFHYGRIFNSVLEVTTYDEKTWRGASRARRFEWGMLRERKNWTASAESKGWTIADCGFDTLDPVPGTAPRSEPGTCNFVLRYHSSHEEIDLGDTNAVARALEGDLAYPGYRVKLGFFGVTYGDMDSVAPLSDSLGGLVLLVFFYLTLTWYFGQVMSSDQGAQRVPWFFITKEYWGYRDKREFLEGDTLAREQQLSEGEQSIRTVKMSMAFDQVTAVKELSLQMRPKEVFCLLGQNGAGKSTTINVLTGLLTPTFGEAFMFGHDIRTNVEVIRESVGVCPQDDVLFTELTAEEHLWFYGYFKGQSLVQAKEYAAYALDRLGLKKDAHRMAKQFSGGMKRRLSFAMSTVGQPKALFLDEPTTGLDPLSRRKVWSMVEELKRERIVVLTTHSMEEADNLGDTIALMSLGRLRAIGTSTFLKERYGSGYQIALLVDNGLEGEVCEAVRATLPGAEVSQMGGGALTVSLPRRVMGHIRSFFDWMDTEAGARAVREWGLSNTTLEEVFVRLAVQNTEVNATLGPVAAADSLGDDTQAASATQELAQVRGEHATLTGAVVRLLRLLFGRPEPAISQLKTEAMPLLPIVAPDLLLEAQGGAAPPAVAPAEETAPDEKASDVSLTLQLEEPAPEATKEEAPAHDKAAVVPEEGGSSSLNPAITYVAVESDPSPPAPAPVPARATLVAAARSDRAAMLAVKQLRGLMLKNAAHQGKQRKSNCCIGCLVVVIVIFNIVIGLSFSPASVNWLEGVQTCDHYPSMYATSSSANCVQVEFSQTLLRAGADASACFQKLRAIPPACMHRDRLVFDDDLKETCCGQLEQLVQAQCHCGPELQTAMLEWDLDLSQFARDCGGDLLPDVDYASGGQQVDSFGCPYEYRNYGGDDAFSKAAALMGPFARVVATLHEDARNNQSWVEGAGWINLRDDIEAQIWFKDSTSAGDSALEEFDLLGAGVGELRMPGVVNFTRFQEPVGLVVSNEATLADLHAQVVPEESVCEGTCYAVATTSSSGVEEECTPTGWLLDSPQQARDQLTSMLPDSSLEILKADSAAGVLDWKLTVFHWRRRCNLCYAFAATSLSPDGSNWGGSSSERCEWVYRNTEINSYNEDFHREWSEAPKLMRVVDGLGDAARSTVRGTAGGFRTVLVQLPELAFYNVLPDAMDSYSLFEHLLFLVVTLCMLHTVVSSMVDEIHSGLLHMMTTMGLANVLYWVAVYLWNIMIFGAVGGFYCMIGAVSGVRFYKEPEPGLWVLTLLIGAHCQVSFAVLLSGCFRSARTSSAVAIIYVIFLVLVGPLLVELIPNVWPPVLQLIPLNGYVYSSGLLMIYMPTSLADAPQKLADAWGYSFLSGLICLAVGQFILIMYPTKLATQSEGFWESCPQAVRKLFRKASGEPDIQSDVEMQQLNPANQPGAGDEDVKVEAALVTSQWDRVSKESAIAMYRLKKLFPGKGMAVNGVSFKVDAGECLGLLGPNGAGKTTLINILAGNMNASSGSAAVCGFDAITERTQIYANLGICPQFDVLWGELTVLEHLLLYARLNGVPMHLELPRARMVAEQVSLDGDPLNQKACELSGGMRRRLSIGISIICDPKVLFLDEPTTGLDPETRQQIWRVIEKIKVGRAIILTTHSMEEADALATRIGIMSSGKLLCLGSQLRLKNIYGDGLQLKVTVDPAVDPEAANRFVQEMVCRNARRMTVEGLRNQTFILPRQEKVSVPEVFRVMETKSAAAGIFEWSLTHTSLEDVFINLVTNASEE